MECKKCGKVLPEKAKFCFECGAKVEQEVICDICGTKMPVGYKFCVECGSWLSVPVIDNFESMKNDKIEENEAVQEPDWDSILKKFEETEDEMDGQTETSEIEQKLSALIVTDKEHITKYEAQQLIRKYLQIVGWKEIKDLGEKCYVVENPKSDSDERQRYYILNLNNVEACTKGDNRLYDEFFNSGIGKVDFAHHLPVICNYYYSKETPVFQDISFYWGRVDWVSSCVNGKVFCLEKKFGDKERAIYDYDNKTKKHYRNYDSLVIIDVTTGNKTEQKAKIKIHSCNENFCRIVINFNQHAIGMFDADAGVRAFYIFDEDGKLILEKQGEYSYRCGDNQFAELMCGHIGLYDEITGRELVPIKYSYVCVWKKWDESILLVGVPNILDYQGGIDYYEYDFVRREVVLSCEMGVYPTSAELCSEYDKGIDILLLGSKLKGLGYEEIDLLAF